MTTYNLQRTSIYDTQAAVPKEISVKSCVDLEEGPYARHGNVLQMSNESMKKQVEKRYGQVPILAMGDFLEVFEMPTYGKLDNLSVFHDAPMGDFRFQVEIANVLDNPDGTRTVTPRTGITALTDTEAGTTVTTGTAPAALGVLGATVGREVYHFTNLRNNHRAVVRLKVTAVPAAPAAGQPPAANFFDIKSLNLFAAFQRYAGCVCESGAQNSYQKSSVTTYA
jgi:hypothetical protein